MCFIGARVLFSPFDVVRIVLNARMLGCAVYYILFLSLYYYYYTRRRMAVGRGGRLNNRLKNARSGRGREETTLSGANSFKARFRIITSRVAETLFRTKISRPRPKSWRARARRFGRKKKDTLVSIHGRDFRNRCFLDPRVRKLNIYVCYNDDDE